MARVLVIDDDSHLRKFLCKLLKKNQDYDVHEAANGEEGLELIRKLPFDLVVTDIFMPGEGGIETIMKICDNYSKIKIIAISGGGNVENVDFLGLANCLGAHKVFQKPIDTVEFLSTVQEMLN